MGVEDVDVPAEAPARGMRQVHEVGGVVPAHVGVDECGQDFGVVFELGQRMVLLVVVLHVAERHLQPITMSRANVR